MPRRRRVLDVASRYLRRAPGTHVYLVVLLVMTGVVNSLHPVIADALLRQLSTNLTEMGRSAGRVLFLSAFLLDGGRWITQAALFTAVFVPLERWIGTWRWLVVVATGHATATLVTTVGIWADVSSHRGGLALTGTIDVGVSYGFFAAVGFLNFGIRSVSPPPGGSTHRSGAGRHEAGRCRPSSRRGSVVRRRQPTSSRHVRA